MNTVTGWIPGSTGVRRCGTLRAMNGIDQAATWVSAAQNIVVLSGAGLSTDSGIPDFRGPNGLWTQNPAAERASTLQHYLADPALRELAWQSRLTAPAFTARPNAGHHVGAARAPWSVGCDRHAEHRWAASGGGSRPGEGDRGAWHGAVVAVLGLQRPAADGADARSGPCRRGRPCLRAVRRHHQERHHPVRPIAGAGRHRGRNGGRRALRSAHRRRLHAVGVPGCQRGAAGKERRRG